MSHFIFLKMPLILTRQAKCNCEIFSINELYVINFELRQLNTFIFTALNDKTKYVFFMRESFS